MTDHAPLFLAYWNMLAPQAARDAIVWTPEYPFMLPVKKSRFDWACVSHRVSVEVDGGQFAPRGGRHASDTDREKLNEAAAHGWRVYRFSPKQLTDNPHLCISQVLRGLGYSPLTD